jgi:hypothetical protein
MSENMIPLRVLKLRHNLGSQGLCEQTKRGGQNAKCNRKSEDTDKGRR